MLLSGSFNLREATSQADVLAHPFGDCRDSQISGKKFGLNKNKKTGINQIVLGDKVLIEAVV